MVIPVINIAHCPLRRRNALAPYIIKTLQLLQFENKAMWKQMDTLEFFQR
jgi:hypothetical protein